MRILYVTFYFEPDLCAGSFRNTALVNALADQLTQTDVIHVVTTQPNRYQSFRQTALKREERAGKQGCRILIDRVAVPTHASGRTDQIWSFLTYYRQAHRLTADQHYDLVVGSSSRLFTAFLGARLARRRRSPLVLDIRDLFRETMLEMIGNPFLRIVLNWVLRTVERYTFGYANHINLVSEGFRPYFKSFPTATYSFFTNGIDEEFLTLLSQDEIGERKRADRHCHVKTILYAGNIGEGQGLHKIIPQAARLLGEQYRFVVIGDGGAVNKLETLIQADTNINVELRKPVSRRELMAEYQKADYLFVHLNDLRAFKRVLPSKLFEYGATDKPIIAGVAGYAAQFVREYIDNSIVFKPGDVENLIAQLRETPYRTQYRADFVARFQRKSIMEAMAQRVIQTVSPLVTRSKTAVS
ncbi:glycosyltransferase family 4 protein [Spirosoma agri]|uniref:Glycosyltransferase family 4 protein n=1 Tax=Spirosoma agri TaxID=1987381 RepID=A0A6M0IQE6_9BACT|nr:glycosyltransferase family 4 protein [Spirosoma agri]NEU69601.1 glycosyltransferase family 4 protein [Spirosoma agri]